jgi:Skp family chaperone for outer membrane proteins
MKFFEDMFRSLEREVHQVKDSVDRMEARLDKIAAGAHYVTRLVEWSEKQDKFQSDAQRRFAELDERLRKLEGR